MLNQNVMSCMFVIYKECITLYYVFFLISLNETSTTQVFIWIGHIHTKTLIICKEISNSHRTDIEIYPAVTCHVENKESVTFQSKGQQKVLEGLFIGLLNTTKFYLILFDMEEKILSKCKIKLYKLMYFWQIEFMSREEASFLFVY